MKESFRARSAFYRVFLRWSFFMQRFSEKNQMWILIGIIVVFRLTRRTVQEINPALLPPLFVVFYLFIFGTWLSTGIANLMILRDIALVGPLLIAFVSTWVAMMPALRKAPVDG